MTSPWTAELSINIIQVSSVDTHLTIKNISEMSSGSSDLNLTARGILGLVERIDSYGANEWDLRTVTITVRE